MNYKRLSRNKEPTMFNPYLQTFRNGSKTNDMIEPASVDDDEDCEKYSTFAECSISSNNMNKSIDFDSQRELIIHTQKGEEHMNVSCLTLTLDDDEVDNDVGNRTITNQETTCDRKHGNKYFRSMVVDKNVSTKEKSRSILTPETSNDANEKHTRTFPLQRPSRRSTHTNITCTSKEPRSGLLLKKQGSLRKFFGLTSNEGGLDVDIDGGIPPESTPSSPSAYNDALAAVESQEVARENMLSKANLKDANALELSYLSPPGSQINLRTSLARSRSVGLLTRPLKLFSGEPSTQSPVSVADRELESTELVPSLVTAAAVTTEQDACITLIGTSIQAPIPIDETNQNNPYETLGSKSKKSSLLSLSAHGEPYNKNRAAKNQQLLSSSEHASAIHLDNGRRGFAASVRNLNIATLTSTTNKGSPKNSKKKKKAKKDVSKQKETSSTVEINQNPVAKKSTLDCESVSLKMRTQRRNSLTGTVPLTKSSTKSPPSVEFTSFQLRLASTPAKSLEEVMKSYKTIMKELDDDCLEDESIGW